MHDEASGEYEEDESQVEFLLGFTQDDCPGCGRVRAVAEQCGCGTRGSEDPSVNERRRALEPVVALLAEEPTPTSPGPVDATAWRSELGQWLEGFLRACQEAAGSDPFDPGPVVAVVGRLREIEDQVAATPVLRPYVAAARTLREVLGLLRGVAGAYVEAMVAEVPDEARRAAESAQGLIDDAAAAMGRFNEMRQRQERIEDRLDDPGPLWSLVGMSEAATGPAGSGGDMFSVDAAGEPLFDRVTGGAVPMPTGIGLGLYLTEIQVEEAGDAERFWEVAGQVYRLLSAHPDRLGRLVGDDGWRDDFAGAQVEMFESGLEARPLLVQERPRTVARAMVRLGAAFFERVAPCLLATVLAVGKGRDYTRLRGRDPRMLRDQVRDQRWEGLTEGLDAAIRDADAHGEFQLDDEGVSFSSDRREYDRLTFDELGDRVLVGWESTLAVHTGLTCAATVSGVDVEVLNPLSLVDAPDLEKLRLLLTMAGMSDVEVAVTGDVLGVSGRASVEPNLSALFGVLDPDLVPSEVQTVRIDVRLGEDGGLDPDPDLYVDEDDRATVRFEGPVGPVLEFRGADDEAIKQALVAQVQATWRRDEQVLLSVDRARFVASDHAIHAFNLASDGELAEAIGFVRPWHLFAGRVGDGELERVMSGMLKAVRQKALGQDGSVDAADACRKVVEWRDIYEAA